MRAGDSTVKGTYVGLMLLVLLRLRLRVWCCGVWTGRTSVLVLIGLCEVATRREDVTEPRVVRNASRRHLGAWGRV